MVKESNFFLLIVKKVMNKKIKLLSIDFMIFDLELIVFLHNDFIKSWFLLLGGRIQIGLHFSIDDKVRPTLVIP
jgi:hypothetical protein